jgi:hypothetical protein
VTPSATATAEARTAPGRRRPVPAPRPRRISGPSAPARGRERAAPGRDAGRAETGLGVQVLAGVAALPSHRLLDRLITSKLWIGVVAFALIGIVTLQLALLDLNRGIGRALERQTTLQRENAALSIENSELAAGDVVESRAQQLGMEIVPQGSLHFLDAHPAGDVARAAAALSAPIGPAPGSTQTASASEQTSAQGASGPAAPPTGAEAGASGQGSTASTQSSGGGEATAPAASESSASASTPPTAASGTTTTGGGASGTEASAGAGAAAGGGQAAPGG